MSPILVSFKETLDVTDAMPDHVGLAQAEKIACVIHANLHGSGAWAVLQSRSGLCYHGGNRRQTAAAPAVV